jgi:SAM-dependent methyltransferase
MELPVSAAAYELAGQSPADWDQIEDEREVSRVLAEIARATRLDVFRCAELYELAYPGYAGDSEFYVNQTRRGRVLYLGVGAGRIFSRIAQANPAAIGIEKSPEMLSLYRSRYPRQTEGRVMLADAAAAELPAESCDTVVAPYSFLQVIDAEALPHVLTNVHRWLRPGGRFLTDTFSTYLIPFRRAGLEANSRQVTEEVHVAIYVTYDHLRQRMREMALVSHNGDTQALEMSLHYYFPHELAEALRQAGFEEPTISGGYRGEPFDPATNVVTVYEARRPRVESKPLVNGHDDALLRTTSVPSR